MHLNAEDGLLAQVLVGCVDADAQPALVRDNERHRPLAVVLPYLLQSMLRGLG